MNHGFRAETLNSKQKGGKLLYVARIYRYRQLLVIVISLTINQRSGAKVDRPSPRADAVAHRIPHHGKNEKNKTLPRTRGSTATIKAREDPRPNISRCRTGDRGSRFSVVSPFASLHYPRRAIRCFFPLPTDFARRALLVLVSSVFAFASRRTFLVFVRRAIWSRVRTSSHVATILGGSTTVAFLFQVPLVCRFVATLLRSRPFVFFQHTKLRSRLATPVLRCSFARRFFFFNADFRPPEKTENVIVYEYS